MISIMMGSISDIEQVQPAINVLKQFNIPHTVKVLSAHRTPEESKAHIQKALKDNTQVFIAAAGMAAHLAGFVAAHTVKPVIGIPINASLNGLDALLSTVQMPGGIPVATTAIGKAGAKNAAYLALQILSVSNSQLGQALLEDREVQKQTVLESNKELETHLSEKESGVW